MKKRVFFILAAFLAMADAFAGNFLDYGNYTVTDTYTGLTWQKTEGGAMAWKSAISYCEGLGLAGKFDWRLPDKKELVSIVNYDKNNPAIDTVYFPNVNSSNYWSSTTYASSTSLAWHVYFRNGNTYYNDKSLYFHVRCVRGGQ
ncbi:MAG: DUF1566 domain-containing protein [Nitrospinae bacterium]|nr:DUF1566 domain-containing protein [Nitrospinota bacterium]